MLETEWSTDAVIRLIEEYKDRPVLWDVNHAMYRIHTAKYEAWSSLSQVFNCDIVDLRKKLNSLFASHRREKSKIRNGGRSTWFMYPYMKFLPSHIENDIVEVNVNTKEEYHPQIEEQDMDQSSDGEESDNQPIIIKQEPVETRRKKTIVAPTRKKNRVIKRSIIKDNSSTRELDNKLIETLKLLKRSDLYRRKDECDTFGEYIATSLRKHDERTQSMIKQAINNILFEQEMKKYNTTGQYTVVLTNMDENPLVLEEHETDK